MLGFTDPGKAGGSGSLALIGFRVWGFRYTVKLKEGDVCQTALSGLSPFTTSEFVSGPREHTRQMVEN